MSIQTRLKARFGLDNNSNTITNVADPINAQDVSTKNFSTNASNLASGTVPIARLGSSGTANSTTYLRGDNTWQTISSGTSVTITDDTASNATYYPAFATATSGTISVLDVSSSKLTYNPSTGTLTSNNITSTNNLVVGGHVYISDNKDLFIGTGQDLYMIHDGTNTSIVNQTGTLNITNTATGGALVLRSENNSGSNFELWSAAAYLDATSSNFRSQDGNTVFGIFSSNGLFAQNATDWPIRSLSSSATTTSRGGILQQRSISGGAITSSVEVGGLSAGGWNGTFYTSGWNGGGELRFVSSENWTSTANGTKLIIGLSPTGGTTLTDRLTINSDGSTTINGSLTLSGNLTINGTNTTVSATSYTASGTTQQAAMSVSASSYRSVEFTVQATLGTTYNVSKLLVIHDGTNTNTTEYGNIQLPAGTDLSSLITADISGGNIRLLVTPVTTGTVYKIIAQAIAV